MSRWKTLYHSLSTGGEFCIFFLNGLHAKVEDFILKVFSSLLFIESSCWRERLIKGAPGFPWAATQSIFAPSSLSSSLTTFPSSRLAGCGRRRQWAVTSPRVIHHTCPQRPHTGPQKWHHAEARATFCHRV